MKDLISVIVPVYEAEKYIEKCLQSVCGQTYRYLEIICVNDGSKDDSASLLDRMAAVDYRVKVVHQGNHGESHARNVGLSIATGSWITFVDNDDWLEPDMYQKMMEAAHSMAQIWSAAPGLRKMQMKLSKLIINLGLRRIRLGASRS